MAPLREAAARQQAGEQFSNPEGKLLWVSRTLPGRTHDLTAARTHRVVRTCVRLRIPALADMAYTGAGGTFAVPTGRPPRKELSAGQRSPNRVHARLRCPSSAEWPRSSGGGS